MQQTHNLDHYRNMAKLFATLNKRSNLNQQQSKHAFKNRWPNTSLFSLLNKTQKISSKIPKPQQTSLIKKRYNKEREICKTRLTSTISVIDFRRPITCQSKQRTKKNETRKQNHSKSTDLFEMVKKQKLDHLQHEKQQLIQQIFNKQKNIIHRIDQDEEDINKPNAINFRTYFSLNKLMNLRDKIKNTVNYRPKTGEDRIKKMKVSSPFV